MKENLAAFIESVKDFWKRLSKKMRVLLLAGTAAVLGIALAIVLILNRTDYVVLYDGLTPTENAEVIAQLQEMGVEGVLEGNRLLVREQDENAVRMQLAYKGYESSGFDYAVFEKGGGLTMTQSDKEYYATAQLQERLQATIETFDEVQRAHVNISIPEKRSFVLETETEPTTAAVKLQVRPGRSLTSEQVQGILNIVKNSVPGLKEENISIADQSGDLLGLAAAGRDVAATKLSLTEQVNDVYKRRVMSMLSPLFREGKVNVAVNSVLETDQKITEENRYVPLDPENPTNNPLDYAEYAREKTGVGGFAQGVPGANDNTDVPEYLAQDEELNEADYYSQHDVFDYLVSSVKSQIVSEGYLINDMTVAVVIDDQDLPAGQMRDEVMDIVATATGIARDKVSVQYITFSPDAVTPFEEENPLTRIVIASGIALLALLIIFTIIIIALARRRKEAAVAEGMEDGATLVDLLGQEEEFEPIEIPESQEQKLKNQIRDLANSDPEIVAQLIKTWLMGST